MPDIPQEIIQVVIDQVAGLHRGFAALKACALVSKSFRPHSQKLLFRSITIDTELPSLSRLHAVLEDNPQLATHARELTLSIAPRSFPEILGTRVVDILTRFTGVTSCIWTERTSDHWPSFETRLRMRLYQFLWSPSLVKVGVHQADWVLVNFLASCEQLKSLAVNAPPEYLQYSTIFPDAASIHTARSTPASSPLEELIVHQYSIVDLVLSLAPQSFRLRLCRLIVPRTYVSTLQLEERKACQQVLNWCAESLEEVRIGEHLSLSVAASRHRPAKRLLTSLRL